MTTIGSGRWISRTTPRPANVRAVGSTALVGTGAPPNFAWCKISRPAVSTAQGHKRMIQFLASHSWIWQPSDAVEGRWICRMEICENHRIAGGYVGQKRDPVRCREVGRKLDDVAQARIRRKAELETGSQRRRRSGQCYRHRRNDADDHGIGGG